MPSPSMTLANIHCLLCLALWQESYLPFPHPFSLDQGATLSSTLLYFRSGRTPLLPWSLGGYCPHWDLRSPCAVAWPPAPLWWWPSCSSWGNPKLFPPVPVPPDSLGWWSFLRPPAAAALPAPWSGPRPPPLGLPRAASSACRRSCSRASCRSLAIRSSCSRWFSAWFQAISSRGSAASCSALRSARTPARASCAFLRTSVTNSCLRARTVWRNCQHEEFRRIHGGRGRHAPDLGLGRRVVAGFSAAHEEQKLGLRAARPGCSARAASQYIINWNHIAQIRYFSPLFFTLQFLFFSSFWNYLNAPRFLSFIYVTTKQVPVLSWIILFLMGLMDSIF